MGINGKVDRGSYMPYYLQVLEALEISIERGELKAGEQLPGEAELCRQFDVSRTVIRQALKELEIKGLILRKKGKGTFISEPKIREGLFQELTGFYQDMESRGHKPVSKVLEQELIGAPPKVASGLNLSPETPVIKINRLRYVNDVPIVLVTTYLPYSIFPNLLYINLTHRSLYEYLENEYGVVIARGHRTFEAVAASKKEAELLQVKKGDPLILIDSISYLKDGTPFEYYHALHRGDRSRFEVELIRVRKHGPQHTRQLEEALRHQTGSSINTVGS
jgi:GntR family transcriptional regulator